MHPEVFRHADCSGAGFKAVWWFISEKTHFGLKHHFPLYLEGQVQCTLSFSGMLIPMVQVSKLYDDPFLRKCILGYNITFLCIWRVNTHCTLQVFRHADYSGAHIKAVSWTVFWENTFWAITSLSFVFRGSKSVHPEVFRHANPNGPSFKAVWWSISEKTHFGL